MNRKFLLDKEFLDATWLNILSFISLSIIALVLIALVALLGDPLEAFLSLKDFYIIIPLISAIISAIIVLFIAVMTFLHGDAPSPIQPIPRLADIKKYIDIDPKDEQWHKYGGLYVVAMMVLVFFVVTYFSGLHWREALVRSISIVLPFHFGFLVMNGIIIGFHLLELLIRCIPFPYADEEENGFQSHSNLPVWAQRLEKPELSQTRIKFAQYNQLSYKVQANYGRYMEMIDGGYKNRLWVGIYIWKRSVYRTTGTLATIKLLRSTGQIFEIHNANPINKLYYSLTKQGCVILNQVNGQELILKGATKGFISNAVQRLLKEQNWSNIITKHSKIRFERDTLSYQQKGYPESFEQLQHLLDSLCDLAEATKITAPA